MVGLVSSRHGALSAEPSSDTQRKRRMEGKTKKTNSKSCNDRTGSSQDNQEDSGHPHTPPGNHALLPYLGALQLAVVPDHEGLLRTENARWHLMVPSASFITIRTKSLDLVTL